MEKFIPFEKLSKKEQKRRNEKQRGTWHEFNPVTRVVPSGKSYNRTRLKDAERKSRSEEREYYFALTTMVFSLRVLESDPSCISGTTDLKSARSGKHAIPDSGCTQGHSVKRLNRERRKTVFVGRCGICL